MPNTYVANGKQLLLNVHCEALRGALVAAVVSAATESAAKLPHANLIAALGCARETLRIFENSNGAPIVTLLAHNALVQIQEAIDADA